jgi:hypothetical protein
MHADEPRQWSDVASIVMPDGAVPFLVGMRDAEPAADDLVFLFASSDDPSGLSAAASADGSQTTFNGSSLFAGSATAQPAYPVP